MILQNNLIPVDLSVKEIISSNFSTEKTKEVQEYALNLLKQTDKIDSIEICDKIIQKFKKNKHFRNELNHFDHQIARLKLQNLGNKEDVRLNNDYLLTLSSNIEKLEKWNKYGFKEELFYKNLDFVDFIFNSFLGSQMKVTKNPELIDINGEPAILVEGKWTKASNFLKQFEIKFDSNYHEKFIFKKDTNQVYTYTDIGQGLVPFHPYEEGLKKPISTLNLEEYQTVLEVANRFEREGEGEEESSKIEPKRTCILQIVTSRVNENKNYGFLTKNLFNMLNRKHPWIRLIEPNDTKEGANVYSVGFGWEKQPYLPFKTILGRFRSIDSWEYQSAERVVTNIAITLEELKKLQEFPEKYSKQPAGFNLMSQNCSVSVRESVFEATGIELPTEIGFKSLFMKISPDFFRQSVYKAGQGINKIRSLIGRITPSPIGYVVSTLIGKVRDFYLATVAFRITLLGILLGSASASKPGIMLGKPDKVLSVPVKKTRYWYDLSTHKFNMPGLLQEWQEKQASTITYNKTHQRFATVPPQ